MVFHILRLFKGQVSNKGDLTAAKIKAHDKAAELWAAMKKIVDKAIQ
jgi:hypothetical protein